MLVMVALPSSALELHVATDGNDTWSGKLARPNSAHSDGPLASLTGARDAIRKLNQQGQLSGPVKVVVADGRYNLTTPLELDPEDTGTAQAPISYEAAKGAHPIFSGGKIIRGWQPGTSGIWHAQIPEVAAGHWYFEQLWVNGRRAVRCLNIHQLIILVERERGDQAIAEGKARKRPKRLIGCACGDRYGRSTGVLLSRNAGDAAQRIARVGHDPARGIGLGQNVARGVIGICRGIRSDAKFPITWLASASWPFDSVLGNAQVALAAIGLKENRQTIVMDCKT